MWRWFVAVSAWLMLAGASFGIALFVLPDRPVPRRATGAARLPPAVLPAKYRFAVGTRDAAIMRAGWSGLEPWGVWSDGPVAMLKFPSPRPARAVDIALQLQPFLPPGVSTRALVITVNNVPLVRAELNGATAVSEIVVPVRAALVDDGDLDVAIQITTPHRPVDFGMGGDSRRLGVGLVAAEVRDAK